jgi:prepilin-type N-terminal cleavage/methylation domain-containing protein
MNSKGFGLTEIIISLVIMSILMISISMIHQYIAKSNIKIHEDTYSVRVADEIFSKLRGIDYYYLFDYDSSLPKYGLANKTFGPVTLQRSTYTYLKILDEIQSLTTTYMFDRWTVSIKYKLRDTTDVNGNGYTSDLRDFIDNNGDKIDDYDSRIRYYDKNSDGDYYDTYFSTTLSKTVSELPDTNLKEVTLKLYKKNKEVYKRTELISLEMFSGIESKDSSSDLKLFISQPANNTYLYNLSTPQRQNAFYLTISKSYPENVIAYRADTVSPLYLIGETVPNAIVRFYLNNQTTLLDTIYANVLGEFNWPSIPITTNLKEGKNSIFAQAVKDIYYSAYAQRDVIYDLNPPCITITTPKGIVYDLMPYIGATIYDTVLSTGIPSGICKDVIEMKCNGVSVPYTYDDTTGKICWKDATSGLPPQLSTGVWHTITVEAGDNAYYKVKSTWSFIIIPETTDHSAPVISDKHPIGTTSNPLPTITCKIFDNQSGINPYSIEMKFDSQIVVSSTNVSQYYNPETKELNWPVQNSLENGSIHYVEIKASHWATDPPDKVTSTENWWFNVNY